MGSKKSWKNDTKALEQEGISDQRDVYNQVKHMKDLLNTARSDLRGRTTPLEPAFKALQLAVLKAHKVLDGLKKVRTFNANTNEMIAAQIARLELLAAATQDQTLPPTEVLNDPGLFYDLEDPWPDHVTTTEDVDIDALVQRHRDRRVKAVLRKGRRRRQHIKDIDQWLSGLRLEQRLSEVRTPLRGEKKTRARKAWGRLVEKVHHRVVAHQKIADILAKGKRRRRTNRIRSIAQGKLRAAMQRQASRYGEKPEAEPEAEPEEDSSSSEEDSSLSEEDSSSSEDQDPLRTDMLGIGRKPVKETKYKEPWRKLLSDEMAKRRLRFLRAGKSPIAKKENCT